ncbi:MAG TPA: TonB family protein [Thermoanaerobaculia bacterium]|jgi:TonB family protein
MFETSVVHDQAAAASRASVLSVSLAAHSIVILGAIGMSLASLDFPKSAPDQFAAFQTAMPMVVPPPLGSRDGGPKPAAQPEAQKPVPATPAKETAPQIVPETVPTPGANASASNDSGPVTEGPGSGDGTAGPFGDPDGVEGGVGTDLDVVGPAAVEKPAEPEKIYTVGGDVKAPRVVRRSEPRFPPALIRVGLHGTIKVQCVIDRNGRLRDAKILFSSQPMLNQAVLDSLPDWRFEPASLNGNAVDAYFDLTVTFSLKR